MSLTIGIIGLPQAGKTTIFHALTRLDESKRASASANKPNQARVQVPDRRLDNLSAIFVPKKTTPATIDFLDVAASGADTEEKGALGKRVLGAFRTVDTLLEVVRCFPHPYQGEPRPVDDLENLELELLISDLSVIQNTLERNKKMAADARAWFESLAHTLEEGERPAPEVLDKMPESAKPFAQSMSLLVAKPCIVCANISEDLIGKEESDPRIAAAKAWAESHQRQFFTVCASIEEELAQLEPAEAVAFMHDLGIEESGLDKIIYAAYRSLDLMTFFTVGEDECRAWTVRVGAPAPEAAGKIHTDLEKGFIRAEVVTAHDLLEHKTIAACRDKGLLRLEGKTYVVEDGDVLNIRFNV
jgi:GTP-binding protein YchF